MYPNFRARRSCAPRCPGQHSRPPDRLLRVPLHVGLAIAAIAAIALGWLPWPLVPLASLAIGVNFACLVYKHHATLFDPRTAREYPTLMPRTE